tara:strand:+ start:2571 stop:2891 length:321 start_codon:yes stop_codon:yes gene_type:complete
MSIIFKKLIVALLSVYLISCSNQNQSGLEQSINDVKDNQKLILTKMSAMEKTIANLKLNNNKPSNNNKKQPPAADPNKVYNVEIGDSFSKGPKNAAVTLIEWTDFQ